MTLRNGYFQSDSEGIGPPTCIDMVSRSSVPIILCFSFIACAIVLQVMCG